MEAGPDDGRRRLPLWMVGVVAADRRRKPGQVEENNNHVDEESMPRTCPSGAKSVSKGSDKGFLLKEKDIPGVNSDFVLECQRKRKRGRKQSLQEPNCDGIIAESVSGKKNYDVRNIGKCIARKGRKPKGGDSGKGEEVDIQPRNDDDVELTMDDLMTLAEEYIKDDKNKKRQASNRECGVSSRKDSEGLLDVPNSDRGSSAHHPTACSGSNLPVVGEENAIVNAKDPAQDMLDLFLGPLLKKPLKEDNRLLMKDMSFSYEFETQIQNNVVIEEREPLMKKKSSLKDKVAMFLD
ncbi:hypothetical protein CJ030_MR7G005997 [Morella rubra]|uniref:Uncharacterized protein n=1 Tax=Morella rubra TaxID=262757 RepID=A0A6A1V0C7_9ROSI|nr:hypothetical protein CJ030_MR7G005997 [Morella rubra]